MCAQRVSDTAGSARTRAHALPLRVCQCARLSGRSPYRSRARCVSRQTRRALKRNFDPNGVGVSIYSGFTHNPHHLIFGLSEHDGSTVDVLNTAVRIGRPRGRRRHRISSPTPHTEILMTDGSYQTCYQTLYSLSINSLYPTVTDVRPKTAPGPAPALPLGSGPRSGDSGLGSPPLAWLPK